MGSNVYMVLVGILHCWWVLKTGFFGTVLKVLTNEKRGGLKEATFDRFPFKLFSLKFSAKSVKALSCERLKTSSADTVFVIWNQELFPNNGIASELNEKIRETCMPRGKLKHRYWFFADAPNIARNYRVIWKDLWWWADSYRRLKYRGGCTIPLFQIIVLCEKCVASRHYSVIVKQL
jgi:hypothetical protein